MKKIFCLSFIALLFLLTACSKDLGWIFKDNAPGVVAPVEETPDGFSDSFFQEVDFQRLATPIVEELFVPFNELGFYDWYRAKEGAIVINDNAMLQDVVVGYITYKWPEIDFDKYSLVIGLVFNPDIDYSRAYVLKQQRAVVANGEVKIYYRFIEVTGDYAVNAEAPRPRIAGALFPKLPDGIAEVVAWKDTSETIDINELR